MGGFRVIPPDRHGGCSIRAEHTHDAGAIDWRRAGQWRGTREAGEAGRVERDHGDLAKYRTLADGGATPGDKRGACALSESRRGGHRPVNRTERERFTTARTWSRR